MLRPLLTTTALAAGAGAVTGAFLAGWRGKGSQGLAYSLAMATNWTLVAVPFATLRLGLLAGVDAWRSAQHPAPTAPLGTAGRLTISALAAGAVGGGLLGWWRGRAAAVVGGAVYALLGASGESALLLLADLRLRWAIRRLQAQAEGGPPPPPSILDRAWWQRPADNRDQGGFQPPAKPLDPVQDLFLWVRSKFVDSPGAPGTPGQQAPATPSWMSPLVNALDVPYRERLDARIAFVEGQCTLLEAELARRRALLGVAGPDGSSASPIIP